MSQSRISGNKREDTDKKRLSWQELKSSLSIFRFILPYRLYFIVGLVFLVLSSLTTLVFPFITGKLVDAATGDAEWWLKDINTIALSLIGILVMQSIFSYFRVMLFAIVSERAMADIRTKLYDKIIGMPIPFFEERRVGELISRITSDVTQLQDTISVTLAELFRQIAMLIVGIAVILVTSTKLTLLMLASYPIIVVIAIVFGRYIRQLSKRTQDALADANIIVEETFQSVSIVKAFTNETFESKRFNKSIGDVVSYALKAARYRGAFIAFVIFGLFGGIVLVMWYGVSLVNLGEMTIGELISFIIYTTFIGGAVAGMGEVYSKIQKTIGASDRIRELLDEEAEINIEEDQHTVTKNSPTIKGDIIYNNVSFRYPTRRDVSVLKGINLHIREGEKIALVGPSGAGKSTIIQLLMSFYSPDDGSIAIGGKLLSDYPLSDLRRSMGIVPQEVILFGGTIRENIAYGKPQATEEEIIAAAKKANAYQFIQSFPDGLDTLVGERGVKLSGGQKQRVAISRAILKDPSILILDEATSSLDSESEMLVQDALKELMKNRTSIIIAHRLSTIRSVDRIFVIDEGNIVESGSHDELIKNDKGLYAYLLKLQFNKVSTNTDLS